MSLQVVGFCARATYIDGRNLDPPGGIPGSNAHRVHFLEESMTRLKSLALSACALFVVALSGIGCGGDGYKGPGSPGSGGTTGAAGSGGASGGTSGTGTAGTGGASAGAGGDTGGTGATAGTGGGAAGTGGGAAGTGGGAAGTGGRGGNNGMGNGGRGGTNGMGNAGTGGGNAGTGGGAAGRGGTGGSGAGGTGGLMCEAMGTCTPGNTCEGTCNRQGLRLECACPASGEFLCTTTRCPMDAGTGTDGGNPTCPTGTSTGDTCNTSNDEVCNTTCSATSMMNRTCLCAPTGGGTRGQWACTALMDCTP